MWGWRGAYAMVPMWRSEDNYREVNSLLLCVDSGD